MMKSNYDFSKGVKNPYIDKLKNGYSVLIHYDSPETSESDLALDIEDYEHEINTHTNEDMQGG